MVKDWGLGDMKHGGLREELLVVPPVLGRHVPLLGREREGWTCETYNSERREGAAAA